MGNLNQNITKRFDLNVGKRCNERCMFCYYLEEIETGNTRDRSTGQIKDILKVGRRWGKTRVDFTGGEPTIRKDLPELIEYAREIGYETRCIITNALVTAKKEKLEELQRAGLNDILISLHAYDPQTHDYLTKIKGAHAKVLKSMENANTLGINLRVNHVVNNLNYKHVSNLAAVVAPYKPNALNFIVFNPTRDAINAEDEIPITYSEISHYLLEMLAEYGALIETINLRHIPFCMVKGFEKHVKTMWQLQYEKSEWDWCMDIVHKRGTLYTYAASLFGMALMLGHPRFYRTNWNTRLHDALQMARIFNDRAKPAPCRQCDLRFICDGMPKEYVAERNEGEVKPYYLGEKIIDPTYFMADCEKEDAARPEDYVKIKGTPLLLFGQYRRKQPPLPRADKRPSAAIPIVALPESQTKDKG